MRHPLVLSLIAGSLAWSRPLWAEPVTLDLVSINAWDLPWPVSRDRRDRLARLVRAVRDRHDVVLFQELWRRRPPAFDRRLVRPAAARASGLAVLTGREVARSWFHPFSVRRGIEVLKRKGVLGTVLRIGGVGEVVVGVLHTQAGRRHGAVRRAQVEEGVGEVLAEAGDRPVILAGDFNLDEANPEDAATAAWIEAQGFEDTAGGRDLVTWSGDNPWVPRGRRARFDRIYLRDGATVDLEAEALDVVFRDSPVSDHYGLRARIALRPR